jgi:acyl-CoA synthetase (AMP-forming)/AMP-acid ligase II
MRSHERAAADGSAVDPGCERSSSRVLSAVPTLLQALDYPSIVHLLAEAPHSLRHGVTLVSEDPEEPSQHRSYANIVEESWRLAEELSQRGLLPGDRVLLVMPTSLAFLTAFLAILEVGATVVPAYPPAALERAGQSLERVGQIARQCDSALVLTTWELLPLLGDLARTAPRLKSVLPIERLLASAAKRESRRVHARDGLPSPTDLALLQYTSGSTGKPKGVALSHANVITNIRAVGVGFQLNDADTTVSWCPLYHDMGLICLLMSLCWGRPIVLMSPLAFLSRPIRWLRAISDHRGTITVAPNFGFALCVKRARPADCEGLDLSSWRIALNGAERVNPQTLEDFTRVFGPYGFSPHAMFPAYGLAESVVGVTFPDPGEAVTTLNLDRHAVSLGRVEETQAEQGMKVVALGRPLAGGQVAVVDDAYRPLPERQIGEIALRGPSLMEAYYRDPISTSDVWREGWLLTGDLGFFSDGRLYLTGRQKDLVIVRGKNYYAEDIEHCVERIPTVRSGGVVAFATYDEARDATERLVLICETTERDAAARERIQEAVREAVRTECSIEASEVVLVPPNTVPKTPSGKRQRSLTRQRYLSKTLGSRRTGKLALVGIALRSARGFAALALRRMRSA